MEYTTNLNLNKPGSSDQYNIQHFNDNFDTLDSHIHTLEESAADVELEIVEKIAEAEQFSNMQGICPISKGGTGANNAQTALNNLHDSVQILNEMPNTAEVTFINHTPADPQEGTPEVKDLQGVSIDVLAEKVFEKIRTDPGLFSQTKNGFVPKTGASTSTRFLSASGVWQAPPGASTVYEATASQSWTVTGDTVLRIEDDCTSVIGNAQVYGTKLIILNETNNPQNVSLLLDGGPDVKQIGAGSMWQYIWTGYWRKQGGGGSSGGGSTAGLQRWLTYSFDAANHTTLKIKGGTSLELVIDDDGDISTRSFVVSEDTEYNFATGITAAADAAGARSGEKNGRVFNIFLAPDGASGVNLVVSTRFDAPSDIDQSYSVNNTRWIGCFSTLCVAVPANTTTIVPVARGTASGSSYLIKQSYAIDTDGFREFYTKTISAVSTGSYYDVATVPHTLAGFAAGDILPESVWCLGFMPSARSLNMNNVLGMVYDRDTDVAIDIYLQSGMGQNTATVYNATHTVSRQQQNYQDDMRQVGKLLVSDDEFSSAALGSNERTAIYGSADKTTVGGHVDTAERRMVSFIGCEEMCGYIWQWTRDVSANGGSGWANYDGQGSFGQTYGAHYALIAGGSWGNTTACGSRCRNAGYPRSGADANTGGRGVSRVICGA